MPYDGRAQPGCCRQLRDHVVYTYSRRWRAVPDQRALAHSMFWRNKFWGSEQGPWTPRAVAVISTAKSMAASFNRGILPEDILLALECGEHQVSQVLHRLGIFPSALLGRKRAELWVRRTQLYDQDFDASLGSLPRMAAEESKAIGDSHIGMEHILLALARVGVPGVTLPYGPIREAWVERMGRS
jgi:hypothetical protein